MLPATEIAETPTEIAKLLGTTEGAVKLRAFRAYERLRLQLSGLVEEDTHSVTRPQAQIGGRPIASRIAAASGMRSSGISQGRERIMGRGLTMKR